MLSSDLKELKRKEYHQLYYQKNKDKLKQVSKLWVAKNKKKNLKSRKKCEIVRTKLKAKLLNNFFYFKSINPSTIQVLDSNKNEVCLKSIHDVPKYIRKVMIDSNYTSILQAITYYNINNDDTLDLKYIEYSSIISEV